MKKTSVILVIASILFTLVATASLAQTKLVSGNLKKLNGQCKIAVDPATGNGLIVWSQGNAKDVDYGRIYAAEITRQGEGSYTVGAYLMVSQNSGSNQRPSIAWLPEVGKYLIVWDTSYYDLTEYLKPAIRNNRPFAPTSLLARTYSPGAGLGPITDISLPGYEVNLTPFVMCYTPPEDVPDDEERALIIFCASDEVGDQGQTSLISVASLSEDLRASHYKVSADAAAPAASDIELIESRALVADWGRTAWTAALSSAFQRGETIYAGGGVLNWHFDMNVYCEEIFFSIDPVSYVFKGYEAGQFEFDLKREPESTWGNIMPLDYGVAAPPDEDFRIVGVSNASGETCSILNDLTDYNELPKVSTKKGDVLDQRLFGLNNIAGAPAGKSNVYILYYDKKGQLRYRGLAGDDGSVTGSAKTVLKMKKNRLKFMDVATFGNYALVAISEMRNKKNYRINLLSFAVQ